MEQPYDIFRNSTGGSTKEVLTATFPKYGTSLPDLLQTNLLTLQKAETHAIKNRYRNQNIY